MEQPLISIVIPTYNSSILLSLCLESIRKQTYKPIEVIVVDNFSNDGIHKIVKKYNLSFIERISNKPEARNIGIKASKGDYILLLDSDMVLEEKLVEKGVEKFENDGANALFIDEGYDENGFWNKCRELEKRTYKGNMFIEAPRFFRREVFESTLFDEKNEGSDEYDFYYSAKEKGLKEGRIDSKITVLESPFNFNKKFRHGKFFRYYRQKNMDKSFVYKQIGVPYRTKLLFNAVKTSPICGIFLIFLKLLEYSSFVLGILSSYFDRKIINIMMNPREFDIDADEYESSMYEKSRGGRFVDELERKTILNLIKSLRLNDAISVLDIGAGNGRWSREFIKRGFNVTSLDISPKMCEYLRNNVKGIKVVNRSIDEIDNFDGEFDLAFSFRAFKYVRNTRRALYNINKSLKENGRAIIEMPNLLNPFYFLPYILAPMLSNITKIGWIKYLILSKFVTKKAFTQDLERAGFEIERVEQLFSLPHSAFLKNNNEAIIKLIYTLDELLSKIFSRSLIFVVKK